MASERYTNWTLLRARPLMDEFIKRMRSSGNVRLSCVAAGIPRSTAYNWRNKFKTFEQEWDEAKDDAVDGLDAEAWKRATDGASDRLLMFLLKAHRPSVYNPVQPTEVSGSGKDGEIEVKQVGLNPEEEKAAMDAFYHRVLEEARTRHTEGNQSVPEVRAEGDAS